MFWYILSFLNQLLDKITDNLWQWSKKLSGFFRNNSYHIPRQWLHHLNYFLSKLTPNVSLTDHKTCIFILKEILIPPYMTLLTEINRLMHMYGFFPPATVHIVIKEEYKTYGHDEKRWTPAAACEQLTYVNDQETNKSPPITVFSPSCLSFSSLGSLGFDQGVGFYWNSGSLTKEN